VVFVNSIISCDVTPCSVVIVHRNFGTASFIRVQGKTSRTQKETASEQRACCTNLTKEAVMFSETTVHCYHTTRHHVRDVSTIIVKICIQGKGPKCFVTLHRLSCLHSQFVNANFCKQLKTVGERGRWPDHCTCSRVIIWRSINILLFNCFQECTTEK
jgi:hypothetical protein